MVKIICVVGELGSGKGTAADCFEKEGFKKYALRDRLREIMELQGVELTRVNMQDFADNLRKTVGLDVFAKKTDELIIQNKDEKAVIESFRNPAELEYFIKKYNAKVIGVVANDKKRFEMILKRNRLGDPKTWEEFLKIDNRDKGIGQEANGQQTIACLKLADIVIENNGTVEDLEKKLSEI